MKHFFAIAMLLFSVAVHAQSTERIVSGFAGPATYLSATSQIGEFQASINFSKAGKKQFSSWIQVGLFSQVLIGPQYQKGFVKFGFQVGAENAAPHWRTAQWVFVSKNKSSIYAACLQGASGQWYVVEGKYSLNKHFGVGIISQRFLGHGGEISIPIKGSELIIAVAKDKSNLNTYIRLRKYF
jgi:hypothetical protein